jgi:hypothetical protein
MKFGLLSAAGGTIAVAVGGFNWGGWVTAEGADRLVDRKNG